MKPIYAPGWLDGLALSYLEALIREVDWEERTDARRERFMSINPRSYTYGKGAGVRTYHSVPMHPLVAAQMERMNVSGPRDYNVCFLNRYDGQGHHLGWHSDDSGGTDPDHPIAVISLGAEREIWWRPIGKPGVVPADHRQLLGAGSLFIMPAGFQQLYQHRIPKSDKPTGTRISLTYRRILP